MRLNQYCVLGRYTPEGIPADNKKGLSIFEIWVVTSRGAGSGFRGMWISVEQLSVNLALFIKGIFVEPNWELRRKLKRIYDES